LPPAGWNQVGKRRFSKTLIEPPSELKSTVINLQIGSCGSLNLRGKKMKSHLLVVVLSVTISVSTGLAQKVTEDWDHDVDFANYQTYMFHKGTPVPNPLMDQRVISAIESELSAKGIEKVESNPDMYVTYHSSTKQDTQYVTDNFGYGYGLRWGGGMGTSTTRSYSYTKGTIVVDLWDATKKQLIWRGSATDTVSDKPEKNSKKIHKAMEKLFKKYPPKGK
jgi:hypothetical protein